MKIGIPVWYGDKLLEKAFKRAKRLGFDYVEVSLDYPWHPSQKLSKLLMKLKKEYNLPLAFHLPIPELNLCHPSNEISKPALKTCMKFLDYLATLEPTYVNIHLIALLSTQEFKEIWKEVVKKAERVAIDLNKFSESQGICLTFENGAHGGLRKISEFEFLLKRNLNLCLDLGHAIVASYRSGQKRLRIVNVLKGWVNKFREVIHAIHWHNVALVENEARDHLVLDSGEMNLKDVADLIRKTNFKYILLECFHSLKEGKLVPAKIADLRRSLKICRELLD